LALKVYPDPVQGAGRVEFVLPAAGKVRLQVLDMQGARVRVLSNGAFSAGRQSVGLDAGALPAGVYLVRLENSAGSVTRRFVIVK
jgi:hypothetical protein